MQYRPELDGLRSFAVVPVILYHAEVAGVGGGFLGVDVFFVLSGFLITSILIADFEADRFSLLEFYERRARRILPALFLVIGVTVLASYLLSIPHHFKETAESALAAVFFVSNIYFWATTSYFAVDAELQPLLHTWSLAVEEQYYILFPLFLMLAWRHGNRLMIGVMVAILIISLGLAQFASERYPSASFFLLPTRAWELMVGALCAFLRAPWAKAGNSWLAALGLVLIVIPMATYTSSLPHPSLWTLPPVLGAAFVIVFARGEGPVVRLLSWSPLVWIGLLSYSAYLWHQPVFALGRLSLIWAQTTGFVVLAIALTFGLAYLSHRFVEKPFRKRGAAAVVPNRALVVSLTSATVVLVGALAAGLWELSRDRFRLAPLPDTRAFVDVTTERRASWSAFVRNSEIADEMAAFPDTAARRILILGDSHAKDLFNALHLNRHLFPDTAIRVAFFTDGCMAPQRLTGAAEETRTCTADLAAEHPALFEEATHILLSMRWTLLTPEKLGEILPAATKTLGAHGAKIGIASSSIELEPEAPFLMARLFRQGRLNASDAGAAVAAARSDATVQVNTYLADYAAFQGLPYLNKVDYLCDDDTCLALTRDGDAVFMDGHHYTLAGASEIGEQIAKSDWLAPLFAATGRP